MQWILLGLGWTLNVFIFLQLFILKKSNLTIVARIVQQTLYDLHLYSLIVNILLHLCTCSFFFSLTYVCVCISISRYRYRFFSFWIIQSCLQMFHFQIVQYVSHSGNLTLMQYYYILYSSYFNFPSFQILK